MGKSALAVTVSLGVANGGRGVLFVSLEMKAAQLAERMGVSVRTAKRAARDGGSAAAKPLSVNTMTLVTTSAMRQGTNFSMENSFIKFDWSTGPAFDSCYSR